MVRPKLLVLIISGFGKSESADKPKDRAEFLTALIKEEKMGKPVIVSPSMSGQFSFPYIFRVCVHKNLDFVSF